jgi:hypothetical protein
MGSVQRLSPRPTTKIARGLSSRELLLKAELGALFINAKTAVLMHQTLKELGHPQPQTPPIQTDNSTMHALLTNKILPRALKAMDL